MPKVNRRPGAAAVSQSTRARRRKAQQFADQADLCRKTACCVCTAILGCCKTRDEKMDRARELDRGGFRPWHSAPHHEPPIGRTNKAVDADTVPLCDAHHTERHSMPAADFWGRHGLDVEQIKARLRAQVEASRT
jgi:hypothetical protein